MAEVFDQTRSTEDIQRVANSPECLAQTAQDELFAAFLRGDLTYMDRAGVVHPAGTRRLLDVAGYTVRATLLPYGVERERASNSKNPNQETLDINV